ncbi:hypothetical protein M422DRAFT_37079 [Sphaerobolus stellatus SS14]|uniref:Uncharacterized protein n=1 Tax=Sphaerobolus stellatus (strain SS14) TaxID=990650 RepID=A0A0C9UUX4_SPHS4|nr:hypothetical protein M422DRAFT_37079 [Sphaerobolus stellatus SS14]
MPPAPTLTLLIFSILAFVNTAAAFGAGAIPNYTYLNDKAFRHGDIEEILPTLLKNVHFGGSEGLWGIIKALFTFGMAGGLNGVRFGRMDVDRIYFGNWLRDYSQAMDIGGLNMFTEGTLLMIIRVLGFMTFGFTTAEFEITPERLGVYLPVEHIDNPKGYGGKEGDARTFHPKLRPPVNPRELEINPHNGMKNYIATEGESWDTSTAHIRKTLLECIRLGRKSKGRDNPDQYEALRLLGTALHTLEDLTAHSNWCELALRKLGHTDIYCHVGDAVIIDTPCGSAPPLVTGTFGSADFMHSVLGEGMDRLSEASMSNLAVKLNDAKSKTENHIPILHSLLSEFLPSSHAHSQKMSQAENLRSEALNLSLDDAAPQEVQDLLWKILEWRDAVYKEILGTIAMIPGLLELFDQLTEALNACDLLDPFLKIQQKMMKCMTQWLTSMHPVDRDKALQSLTKEAIRGGRNKRFATKEELEAQEEDLKQRELLRQTEDTDTEEIKISGTSPKIEKKGSVRYKPLRRTPVFDRFDGRNRSVGVMIEEDDEPPTRPTTPYYLPDTDEEDEPAQVPRRRSNARGPLYVPPPIEDRHFRPASILLDVEAGFQTALGDNKAEQWKTKRKSTKGKEKAGIHAPETPPATPKRATTPVYQRYDSMPRKPRPSVTDVFGYNTPGTGGKGSRKEASPPPAFFLNYTGPPLYYDDEGSSVYAPMHKGKARR